MSIKLLSEEIINQIAAGEVIENPSAVIKELIENSIDAKSNLIEVEIENYGLNLIMIKDNGIGIKKNDLLKAPLRHATSKISNFNDLYNIKTMGFRGEALASIFSIAKTKIISKHIDSKQAYEVSSFNINKLKKNECKNGTQVIVENIFYNTPARKKYLKSNNLELKAIVDVMKKFTILHKNIKFSLKHNGKILINKPIFNSNLDNICYILGKNLKNSLFFFKDKLNGLKISGFVGNPSSLTYAVRKNQFLFVNSRFIKSKLISKALYHGFGTNLMESRHPFFIIFLEIDPEVIDVNIHPTKIEIKFENELEVYNFISKSIKKVFEKQSSYKKFEDNPNYLEHNIPLDKKIDIVKISNIKKEEPKENKYYKKESQFELEKVFEIQNNFPSDSITINDKTQDKSSYGPLFDDLKDYRIVGQINKTFIIIETPKSMIMIDQHVAEEKFFFETFKFKHKNTSVKTQKLLKSQILTFTQSEMLLFDENKSEIKKLGFICEKFGEREIIIREVPFSLSGETVDPEILTDIIHEISIDKKFLYFENKTEEKLASLACKKSIKAGKELTNHEIKFMIENLKKLKEPFNCPHGRPILLKWDYKDLERKFKRIV